jgi:hypothetical protein
MVGGVAPVIASGISALKWIGQPHQSPLGKGHVQQRRGRSERQANADPRQQQKRGEGPQLIQHENKWEEPREGDGELAVIEGDCGQQIEPQGNSGCSCYQHRAHDDESSPAREKTAATRSAPRR